MPSNPNSTSLSNDILSEPKATPLLEENVKVKVEVDDDIIISGEFPPGFTPCWNQKMKSNKMIDQRTPKAEPSFTEDFVSPSSAETSSLEATFDPPPPETAKSSFVLKGPQINAQELAMENPGLATEDSSKIVESLKRALSPSQLPKRVKTVGKQIRWNPCQARSRLRGKKVLCTGEVVFTGGRKRLSEHANKPTMEGASKPTMEDMEDESEPTMDDMEVESAPILEDAKDASKPTMDNMEDLTANAIGILKDFRSTLMEYRRCVEREEENEKRELFSQLKVGEIQSEDYVEQVDQIMFMKQQREMIFMSFSASMKLAEEGLEMLNEKMESTRRPMGSC